MPLTNIYIRNLFCVIVVIFTINICYSAAYAQNGSIKTVVIDPGHGGHDPGALSRDRKYKEKNITLAISLKLGALIKAKHPNIKVLYTRSTDRYVGFDERTSLANRNKADLFISIHVNSTGNTSVRGTETFVMGMHKSDANFEVCKKENSVLVMEEDHKTQYEGFDPNSPESYIIFSLLQNTNLEQSLILATHIQNSFKKGPITSNRGVKQGGLLVLWKTTMPAVLSEVGFISNSSDLKLLVSSWGQNQLAQRLFDAFEAYRKDFEKSSSSLERDNYTYNSTTTNSSSSTSQFYAIQILAVDKPLKASAPDLKKRRDYNYIKVGKLYKYYLGNYSTQKDATNALKALKGEFKGAFIIKIKDNKIVK